MIQSHIQQGLPQDAASIRQDVFVQEQGFQHEFDETDQTAWHLVLYQDNAAVGCCRFFPAAEPGVYVLGRLAVRSTYRGHHYGERIVQEVEAWLHRQQGRKLILSAQVQARPFYERLGYQASGEEYLDEHCPHIHMEKELSGSVTR